MKQMIRSLTAALAIVPMFAFVVGAMMPPVAMAAPSCATGAGSTNIKNGVNCSASDNQPTEITGSTGMFKKITDVLLFIIGAVAVIMLIIGGIRYTVSGGDSNAVTSAKNTILYAIVGIVVALLAYAIINWVVTSFATTTP